MSFLAIVAVVAFILAMLNRASRKSPYVYRDNDNAHLFRNSDGFVQDKSINKKDLTDEIKSQLDKLSSLLNKKSDDLVVEINDLLKTI